MGGGKQGAHGAQGPQGHRDHRGIGGTEVGMRYFLQMGYFSLENDRNQEVRWQNLKAKIVKIFV